MRSHVKINKYKKLKYIMYMKKLFQQIFYIKCLKDFEIKMIQI